jgi:RNA polymerase sigma-70 factor, ECF subfamily
MGIEQSQCKKARSLPQQLKWRASHERDRFSIGRELILEDDEMREAVAHVNRPVELSTGARLQLSADAGRVSMVVPVSDRQARLRWMVDAHIDFVARVLRNAGTPEAEIDDDVQRTFIAVAKRLDDIREGSEKTFLLQTALRVAAHARRTLARRREVHSDETIDIVDPSATPEQLTDRKRARHLLDEVLSHMNPDLRAVFVLYEFEEMNMAEIAATLSIPRGTVASRLRRARLDFHGRVRMLEGVSEAEAG